MGKQVMKDKVSMLVTGNKAKGEVSTAEMSNPGGGNAKRSSDEECAQALLSSPEISSSRLRPRKQFPCFRMVELNEKDNKRIVGMRVKVYWSGSRRWFAGSIKSFDTETGLHRIHYDDGDKEELDLREEKFELEIKPSDSFTLKTEPHSRKKVKSSDGDKVSLEILMDDWVKVGDTEHAEAKKNEATKKAAEGKSSKSWVKKDLISEMDVEILPERIGEVHDVEKPGHASSEKEHDDPRSVRISDGVIAEALLSSPERSSSRLRPRKELPFFRMVELNEKDNKRIVGMRVKVYWSGSRRWFAGSIKSFDAETGLHRIHYDDGDKEELDLREEKFELEIKPSDSFTLKTEPHSRKKVKSSDGDKVSLEILMDNSVKVGDTEHAEPEKNVALKTAAKGESSESQVKKDLISEIDVKILPEKVDEAIHDEVHDVEKPGYSSSGKEQDERKSVRISDGVIAEALLSSPERSSSRLRPRKELPFFRMVELNEKDNKRIVGMRVKVYWSGSRRWFAGSIKSFDAETGLHSIHYDDGDEEELNLSEEKFELEIKPSDSFALKTEPHFKKKVSSFDGDKVRSEVLMDNAVKVGDTELKGNAGPKKNETSKNPTCGRSPKSYVKKDTENKKMESLISEMEEKTGLASFGKDHDESETITEVVEEAKESSELQAIMTESNSDKPDGFEETCGATGATEGTGKVSLDLLPTKTVSLVNEEHHKILPKTLKTEKNESAVDISKEKEGILEGGMKTSPNWPQLLSDKQSGNDVIQVVLSQKRKRGGQEIDEGQRNPVIKKRPKVQNKAKM